MNQLGRNIKDLRHIGRFTQKDIADLLGVSVITIGAYESGRKVPRLDKLIKLADFFQVNLDSLIRGKKLEIKSKNGSLSFVFPADCDSHWLDRMIPVAEQMLIAMKQKRKEFQ